MTDHVYANNEKNIAEVLRELKGEASSFVNTRYELLSAEIKEKAAAWKKSVPMVIAGVVFAMGTFATFTFTLVSWLAITIGTPYAWTWGFLIVCVVYGCIAGTLISVGIRRLKAQSLAPERTIRVLKQDQRWIQEEARGISEEARAA